MYVRNHMTISYINLTITKVCNYLRLVIQYRVLIYVLRAYITQVIATMLWPLHVEHCVVDTTRMAT